MVNWKLPLEGWFKLSVDATRGLFGPGVVVYNYLGKVMCQEFINVIMWMMLILVRLRPSTLAYNSLLRLIYLRYWYTWIHLCVTTKLVLVKFILVYSYFVL